MSDMSPSEKLSSGLVVVSGNALSSLPDWELEPKAPVYLASEVLVSAYGIKGFLLVDSQPENRVVGYGSTKWYASGEVVSGREEPDPLDGEVLDPLETARRYGTRHGFKAIRFFVLPHAVTDFFVKDKWLGEPVIEKCLEEGTTPAEYYEQPVNPADMLKAHDYNDEQEQRKLAALARILPLVDPNTAYSDLWIEHEQRYDEYFGTKQHRAYLSFHPWQIYQEVTSTLTNSVRTALENFDEALKRFDVTGQGRIAAAQEWLAEGNAIRGLVSHTLEDVLPSLPEGDLSS